MNICKAYLRPSILQSPTSDGIMGLPLIVTAAFLCTLKLTCRRCCCCSSLSRLWSRTDSMRASAAIDSGSTTCICTSVDACACT